MRDSVQQWAATVRSHDDGEEHVITFFLINDAWGVARGLYTSLLAPFGSSVANTFTYQDQFLSTASTTIGSHYVTIRFVTLFSLEEARLHADALRALKEESTAFVVLTVINCAAYAASCTDAYLVEQALNGIFTPPNTSEDEKRSNKPHQSHIINADTYHSVLLEIHKQVEKNHAGSVGVDQFSPYAVGQSVSWPLFHIIINTSSIPLMPQIVSTSTPFYATLLPLYYISTFYPSSVLALRKDQPSKPNDSTTQLSQGSHTTGASSQRTNLIENLFLLTTKTDDVIANLKEFLIQMEKGTGYQWPAETILLVCAIFLSFASKVGAESSANAGSNALLREHAAVLATILTAQASLSIPSLLLPAGWNTFLAVESSICSMFSYDSLPHDVLTGAQFHSLVAVPSIASYQPNHLSISAFSLPAHAAYPGPVVIEAAKRTEFLASLASVTAETGADGAITAISSADNHPASPVYSVGAVSSTIKEREPRQDQAPISSTFALSVVVASAVDEAQEPERHPPRETVRRGKSITLVEESDTGIHELPQGSLATPDTMPAGLETRF